MQIIESTNFFVRAAIFRLVSTEHDLEYIAFPMIHIGEPDYYESTVDPRLCFR